MRGGCGEIAEEIRGKARNRAPLVRRTPARFRFLHLRRAAAYPFPRRPEIRNRTLACRDFPGLRAPRIRDPRALVERLPMSDRFWDFPYPSRRMPVLAANVAATSQPLAARAGLRAMERGGNAVDAAIATAMALTVVEPTGNGLGSDAFALVWDGDRLHGFNGSGRSPAAWSPERFAGRDRMPEIGWDAVTVPGAVDAWARLHERFGRLSFPELAEPAIRYARDGFAVSPIIAAAWAGAAEKFGGFPNFARTFLPGGRAPRAGERFVNPDQGRSLERIAESRGEDFYRGELARRIVACAAAEGGAMTLADLGEHRGQWIDPIHIDFAGIRVHEIPPNGQGLTALIALGILRNLDMDAGSPDSADTVHRQVEAMKIAFALAHAHIADPDHMRIAPDALLAEDFLAGLAKTIRMDRAAEPGPPHRRWSRAPSIWRQPTPRA
jgi:gamma-glutamyltranspeptidase / glutathione hydrolase